MPFTLRAYRMPRAMVRVFTAILLCAAFTSASTTMAQTNQDNHDHADLQIKPIYVTTRIFQVKAKRGSYEDLNNQVFKMKTSKLTDYDQWIAAFKKTYPEFDMALLKTEAKRVFRTAKPTIISLGKQPDGRDIEVMLFGAQSTGDGVTPGTTIVPEISLHFGNDMVKKPVTYAIQQLEVESGSTYFFSAPTMKMSSTDYVRFVRPNAPAAQFDGNDIFLVFAFSVDLEKPAQPARYYDERQSIELQNAAAKKIPLEVPTVFREAKMGGYVRVYVEISPEGKVTVANVQNSTFPEMNNDAIAAARQWEFPMTFFTDNKNPITGFLLFNFPLAPETPKAPAQNSEKQ
jgi:TonB family protein